MNCVFCAYEPGRILAENELFYAIRDKYPVTQGHTLIVSKRHCETYFDLNSAEVVALQELSILVRARLEKDYACSGFNLAMNCGASAGQSIGHFHLHIIPRGKGRDSTLNPRVRESIF